jgi:hypothetical protein
MRHMLNKGRSARSFSRLAPRVHPANFAGSHSRGGIRL